MIKFNKWIFSFSVVLLSQMSAKAFLINESMTAQSSQLEDLNLYFKNYTPIQLKAYKTGLDIEITSNMTGFLQSEGAKKADDCASNLRSGFYLRAQAAQSIEGSDDFEQDIVMGSGSTCVVASNSKEILDTLFSQSFLLATIKGVTDVQVFNDKNVICQQSSVFPFGKSNFCFKLNAAGNDNQLVVRISHLRNNSGASYNVLFQESVILIKRIKENAFRVSSYNIGRGPDIPLHGFALKIIQSEQKKYFDKLNEYFGTPN
ncbi:hypothetical protein CIK05_05560 [Bdellovibrio sp. qaytius]|nr:hypothetical protein CIK05_05560 [Bdellovibrio sp. qaytius]